ncbi:MAG: hypothetical protein EBU90_10965 [Proteobacteria bacterium]|nr:hypothetical protein [Pseudomonadota bacterium]NBP14710.1 hypothetical protein [bacterium]
MKILSFFLFIFLNVFSILSIDYTSANSTQKAAFASLNQNHRVWIYHGSGDPFKGNRHFYKIDNASKILHQERKKNPHLKWVLSQHPFFLNRYLLLINTNNPNDIERLDLHAIMQERR